LCKSYHPKRKLANVSSCTNHPERKLANVSNCTNHPEKKLASVSSCTNHPERKLVNMSSCANHPETKLAIQKGSQPMRDGDFDDDCRFTDVQLDGNGVQMCRSWMRHDLHI